MQQAPALTPHALVVQARRLTAEQYLQLVLSCVEPDVHARWTAIYQKGEGAMRRELQAQRMALLRKQRQQQEQEAHAAGGLREWLLHFPAMLPALLQIATQTV